MNQKLKKDYDSLHKKIEAIYLGATGKTVDDPRRPELIDEFYDQEEQE